ncbi:MAG: right-handed parallel beta-helix repeat-containing protein [Thiobacillus sp.]
MTQTKFKLNRKALFGLMVLAAIGAAPVHAATFNVVPTLAAADGVADDGLCSLREAMYQINTATNYSPDCTNSSADAYGTNDTINLAAGTYNLAATGLDESWTGTAPNFTVVNNPDTMVGDIDIMKSVHIVGAGADATIIQWDASVADIDRDRIFHVYTTAPDTVNVVIEGVTIQGGRTFEEPLAKGVASSDPNDPVLYDYYFRRAGGGVAVGAAANVAQVNPAVTGVDNSTGRGGSRRPGESEPAGPTFSLTLTGVKVLANQAQGDGAGIYTGSPVTATNVVVSGNTSTVNGGGVYNEGNTTISNSTISGNTAEGGGGIFLTGSNTVTISGSTLSGNTAVGGGGISGRAGMTLKVVNSTISGNIGSDVGAGIYSNGNVQLNFVTIAKNVAGSDSKTQGSGINMFPASQTANSLTLKNVLLAGNMAGSDPAALISANCGVTGGGVPVTSQGSNLSSDASCDTWLTAATDKKSVDPKIGDLANNGGLTLTHALLAGSPALGAGAADAAVTVDQRGVARETPPDIGAFELVTAVPPAPASTDGGGGGGCAIGGDGRLDPTLPALLAAALGFFGWRRSNKAGNK